MRLVAFATVLVLLAGKMAIAAPVQITFNDYDDDGPQVSGSNVVWHGDVQSTGKGDTFFWNGSTATRVTTTSGTVSNWHQHISGSIAVWDSKDHGTTPTQAEIFRYDRNTGVTTQLTGSSVYDNWRPRVSGSNVVWNGEVPGDREVFLYAGTFPVTQIINTGISDSQAQVDGSDVVWQGGVSATNEEIFHYDTNTTALTRITNQPLNALVLDQLPQVSDSRVVWTMDDGVGGGTDIRLYNVNTGTTVAITNDSFNDRNPQISGTNVVWERWDPIDSEYEIFHYDVGTGVTTQLTNNDYSDTGPQVDGSNVVWYADVHKDAVNHEIFLHKTDLGTTFQLTNNSRPDWMPQVSGMNVVWSGIDPTGTDYEIFTYDVSDLTVIPEPATLLLLLGAILLFLMRWKRAA